VSLAYHPPSSPLSLPLHAAALMIFCVTSEKSPNPRKQVIV